MDTVLAGWRHGTKRGWGPRWLIVLLISSPPSQWWGYYLHLRVHHHHIEDLALQEVNLVTVDLTLAGWRHDTKRGRGPRWLLVLLITYYSVGCIFTSVSTISR